jgi:hypothetical protein
VDRPGSAISLKVFGVGAMPVARFEDGLASLKKLFDQFI